MDLNCDKCGNDFVIEAERDFEVFMYWLEVTGLVLCLPCILKEHNK